MDKQTNKTNLKVLAALGLMMTSQQVNAVAISSTESALSEHRHKSHHHHRHQLERPEESDKVSLDLLQNQNPEQLAERRTLDVVREELQAELHNSDDEQEHQEEPSEYSKPETEQEEEKPQQMAQFEQQVEEYKPEPIRIRAPVQSQKTADLIAQAIIHQNQKAQGMTDDQIYGGASTSAADESEFGFGSTTQEAKPIAEKIQQIEQKPIQPKFQMAEISEPIKMDAQENAVQKTLKLIKERQASSNTSAYVQKPKQLFPIFDKPVLATAEEQEEIVAPPKKVVIQHKQIKKVHVMNEEENAQAEVEAMLEVEKRQESARNKQTGGNLVQDSKPAGSFSAPMDMHIDSSIIDKVRNDTDKEMTDIDNEAQRTSIAQSKAEERGESSSEEEEMTEQEKLYGRQEKPQKHHQKPQPVQQKVEEPEVVPEVKQTWQTQSLSQSTSAEDAKQMAVQKTLDLINKFKKNENHEQATISPTMSFPEPVQQAVQPSSKYNKDQAIQKILETIRQKHNLPPVASKKPLTLAAPVAPVAPQQSAKRSEIQEIQDKIDQTKLEMKKLPNAPEYGIETSKLDIDESEFVTKANPQAISSQSFTASPKVESKKVLPQKQDTTFQIETTRMDADIESPKQEISMKKVTNVKSAFKSVKPQTLQQKKASEGNEYKIETTSVDMESLKSIVGDTSDLDFEKVQAQELSKIHAEEQRQEKLRKEAEEARQEELRIERETLAAEKKAAQEEEERQRQEILQEQEQKIKKLQQEEIEIKQREMKLKQEEKEQAKTLALSSLPLTVPVINNKDPKVSQSLTESEKPQSIPGEINQMNNNMRGMLREIVETIQPALEESVGPDNSAKVKVVVTPIGNSLSQSETSKAAQEYTFDDTRSTNAQSSVSAPVSAPAAKDTDLKAEEKKPEVQAKQPEAFPAAPIKAEESKPVTQAASAPQPMSPPTPSVEAQEKAAEPVKTEGPAGPSQSAIQNAIQATLSKIKADKSLEDKSVDDFKKETEKIEQERKESEAKTEAIEKVQKESEEAEEKTKLANLKDSVVANMIKAGKAKEAEKKAAQEAIKKKQDQAKALAKQETENMNDLIKVGEATHKNPLISNVVANTIALMKKQKEGLNSSPFSHLFDTLHGDALMQQSESAKVTLPEKTAVKSQLSNIKNAVKASVVKNGEPKQKSLIQLNEDPVDVRVKVNIDDDDTKGSDKQAEEKAEAKERDEERAAEEKSQIEDEANCEKQRGLKEAQDNMFDAKKQAKADEKRRNKEIRAHDRQQAQDEEKERENQATGRRVDRQYKDGQKIVGVTMDAANKAQENSADAVNAAGSAQIVDNHKDEDAEAKKAEAVKDAIDEKQSEQNQEQSSGELVKAKNEAKDIQSALDKVTYSEEKDKFVKEKEEEKTREAQENRAKALKEQKDKEETARKEDEMRDKITKETNEQIKVREEREAAIEKDKEEAESLKKLTAFKEKQDQENKERKEREAQSKKEAEAQQKKDFEQKEKDLDQQAKDQEAAQDKIEEERRKFADKQAFEKQQDEQEAKEEQEKIQQKAKYDKAFRDGEISKAKDYSGKEKAEAAQQKMQDLQRKIWESKQNKDQALQTSLEKEKRENEEQAEKERKEEWDLREKELKDAHEREKTEKSEERSKQNDYNNRGGYGGYQQPYNQGYGGPPQQPQQRPPQQPQQRPPQQPQQRPPQQPQQSGGYNNGGGYGGNNNQGPQNPQNPQNNGYNNGQQHYDQEDKSEDQSLVQKSNKVEERKSVSAAQVVAQAPKATVTTSKAPVPAKVAAPAPTTVKLVEEKPKAVAAPLVVAKSAPAQASVAKVTPPKENSQNKGTVLIQAEDKPSKIILDQKDEKDTELFNRADVQDENWLELTFHKIGMNVKSVFNKLFLPQLQSSNLSHQEKIELMMLWEEHHDQDDK